MKSIKTVNSTVGFVPTMGALHQGHLALMQQSLLANENTVVSILLTTNLTTRDLAIPPNI
jgi:pantoate--beta-alanine ligase